MRPDEDPARVRHMLESALAIQAFLKGRRRQLGKDDVLREAILRRFELLGQAAAHVTPRFREAHPEIPWKRLIAFGAVLLQADDRIDLESLGAAIDSLPGLVAGLKRLA